MSSSPLLPWYFVNEPGNWPWTVFVAGVTCPILRYHPSIIAPESIDRGMTLNDNLYMRAL